ncbi:MAG: phosphotransferase family protein [Gammaproteobacteria bacterium]|nr:phosphotransferase family protein [Gammaproteobacteria bacterium]MCP5199773.1 phosphotransferase family protein [Gammaproteobacteria bacterium]
MARDLERMLDGLRGYLADGSRLSGIVPLSTGHSNETYLLEGIDRILRMPPSEEGLLPPYDMALQHAVLAAMGSAAEGPPVPAVYELCSDPAVIGDAFFVMQRLDGEAFEYVTPAWLLGAPSSQPDAMCRQWIAAVTAVHRLPADCMPAATRSPVDEARHWLAVAEEAEAPAALLEVLHGLVGAPPRSSGPVTPVHGDPKHGNCLWARDGRLLALLDWEMAGIGEPMTDLGYIAHFYDQGEAKLATAGYELPGWWSKAQVVDAWERATGRQAVDLMRYEALAVAKIAAIIALGYHLFASGRTRDPRFEAWAAVIPGYVDMAVRFAAA